MADLSEVPGVGRGLVLLQSPLAVITTAIAGEKQHKMESDANAHSPAA